MVLSRQAQLGTSGLFGNTQKGSSAGKGGRKKDGMINADHRIRQIVRRRICISQLFEHRNNVYLVSLADG